MQYKLLAVDVDGTLLNSKKELTPATKQAVLKAIDKGVIFCISSGRPVHAADRFTKLFGIEGMPFILYNGALVVTGPEHRPIFSQYLTSIDALELINLGISLRTTVIAWSDDKLYVSEFNERSSDYEKISGIPPLLLDDPLKISEQGAAKVLWYGNSEDIPGLLTALDASPVREHVNRFTSNPKFIEIVDKRCSKALALEKLAAHYGIKQEEIIAIGDGYNDLPMLQYAGLGIAMGNAVPEIKAQADDVTLSNDDDGVAAAICKYIL